MQIMKLVYIAHGWSLGLDGRPLVNENVEAWRYGPVLPNLYQRMKMFGAQPVGSHLAANLFSPPDDALSERERDVIAQTFRLYGSLNGIQLSDLTHRAGTPWSVVWNARGQNAVISPDLIAEHYRQLANERTAA